MNNKEYAFSILVIVVLITCFVIVPITRWLCTGEVCAVVDFVGECVELVDEDGEVWVWELEEDDHFEVGQQVTIQFFNNGTADLYDDEIIEIRVDNQ